MSVSGSSVDSLNGPINAQKSVLLAIIRNSGIVTFVMRASCIRQSISSTILTSAFGAFAALANTRSTRPTYRVLDYCFTEYSTDLTCLAPSHRTLSRLSTSC